MSAVPSNPKQLLRVLTVDVPNLLQYTKTGQFNEFDVMYEVFGKETNAQGDSHIFYHYKLSFCMNQSKFVEICTYHPIWNNHLNQEYSLFFGVFYVARVISITEGMPSEKFILLRTVDTKPVIRAFYYTHEPLTFRVGESFFYHPAHLSCNSNNLKSSLFHWISF